MKPHESENGGAQRHKDSSEEIQRHMGGEIKQAYKTTEYGILT